MASHKTTTLRQRLTSSLRGCAHDVGFVSLKGQELLEHCLRQTEHEMLRNFNEGLQILKPGIDIIAASDERIEGDLTIPNDAWENGLERFPFIVAQREALESDLDAIPEMIDDPNNRVLIGVTGQGATYIRDITSRVFQMEAAATIAYDLTLWQRDPKHLNLMGGNTGAIAGHDAPKQLDVK